MIPTALEKDAFPALASALTFESKSTQKSTFSRKERSDECFYSVQRGVPQTAPSYELFRKYPRYCGSPKMNIFKRRNETMILLLRTRRVPQTASSYELSRKYPRFWGSPKMTHFQIRKTSFGSFSAVSTTFWLLFSVLVAAHWNTTPGHHRSAKSNQKKQFSAAGENRGRRARALESL